MKLKRIFSTVLAATMMMTALVGCGSDSTTSSTTGSEVSSQEAEGSAEDALKIALLIPGNLGDKSFYDSANNGIKMVEESLGAEIKVVEMGLDQTKWEPTLLDFSEQDWDVIVTGSWEMTELLNEAAVMYPDKKYINFDTSEEATEDNVYAMFYKTNELAFMAGTLAALQAEEAGESTIGFVGGMDNPGINDFLIGYIEGAQNINPDIKVAISYVGSFVDATKGKETALAMYNQGISIIFQVAGQTGLGVIDAAKETGKYAIGVDSDQAMAFAESDPEKANQVITSAIKKIDESIVRAIELHVAGELPYGTHETLGVKEGAVGLAKNDIYNKLVSNDIKQKVDEVEQKLANGKIEVGTAFGQSTEQIEAIRAAVRP